MSSRDPTKSETQTCGTVEITRSDSISFSYSRFPAPPSTPPELQQKPILELEGKQWGREQELGKGCGTIIIKKRNLQVGGGGISILQEKTPTLPSLSLYIKTNIIITKGTEPTRRRGGFEGFTSRLDSILQKILPNIILNSSSAFNSNIIKL